MQCQSQKIQDTNSLDIYRTRIPNIIFELDLDPQSLCLYLYYKRVAGDYGMCKQRKKYISKNINMSTTIIKERNKVLSQGFQKLAGKPLIKITQRKSVGGNNLPTLVEICDIWSENFQKLSETENEEVDNV